MSAWLGLEEEGYVIFDGVGCLAAAEEMTERLGAIRGLNGERVQILRPRAQELAKSRSFSHYFGKGGFPLHTDTAFWATPARYLVLYMEGGSSAATIVLSKNRALAGFEHNVAGADAIFTCHTEAGHIYGASTFGVNQEFIRYDSCYMQPANQSAQRLREHLHQMSSAAIAINWPGKRLVVIDNWRTLHGRAPVSENEPDRELFRFYRG